MSYQLFYKNEYISEENAKNEYIDLKYITKLIVLAGFCNCLRTNNMKITNLICNIINYEHKDLKFIDIINHTSGLEYEWSIVRNNRNVASDLRKRFMKASNIYDFSLSLKKKKNIFGNYNYNNYTYNILAYTVYFLTGKNICQYLEENILLDIDYKWDKINGIPIASFGLYIHSHHMKKFLLNLKDNMFNNSYYSDTISISINSINYKFIGKSTKDGSYYYYCYKLDCFFAVFNYDIDKNDYIYMLIKKIEENTSLN